jgi:cation-transporting ATPase E
MTHIDAGAELDPVHPHPIPAPAPRAVGLTAAEVAERVARGEVNDVPVRSSRSTADIVRANVFTRFNAIIGVLWLIMMFVAPFQDSLFGYVILANTGIGIIQELRAKKTLDSLAVIGEARPTVRRDGVAAEVGTSEIVLGDLIEIGPGDKIVVDGECVEADGLEIDESLLTGEADPVVKQPGDQVMSGSFVVAGGGAFTATKVGREAYAVQLAEEASRFTLVHSELRTGISTILKYVTWMMIPAAIGLAITTRRQERRLQGLHRPRRRRHRAHGPGGAGPPHLRRLRDRRHPAWPETVPRPGTSGHRGPRPRRHGLPRQDGHADRGRHGRHRAAAAGRQRRVVRT